MTDEKDVPSQNMPKGLSQLNDRINRLKTRVESTSGRAITHKIGTVYLLLDCSESMAAVKKLASAKEGCVGFVQQALHKGYAVGCIAFSTDSHIVAEAQRAINGLSHGMNGLKAAGITNMSRAIAIAGQLLEGAAGARAICLFTDGWPNDRSQTIEAANAVKRSGVDILTVGTDDADVEFLAELASKEELAAVVSTLQIESGIASMALRLPGPTPRAV